MLPTAHRLTDGESFRHCVRAGRRAGSRHVVVHVLSDPSQPAVRAGFVVSKVVGNAVVRNRVKRRLRHLVGDRLAGLSGGLLVVRALPAAAEADYRELGADLDRCLERIAR